MPGRAGVLGRPITHSLSPVLHRAAYAALGLDWTYEPLDCGVAELTATLGSRTDWAGFSCTMPLKHAALSVASEVRPAAATVGAANTLIPGPDGWIADNTDVAGIVAAVRERGVDAREVTVLGAGGTAQAALVALAGLGTRTVRLLVREPSRAGAVVELATRLDLGLTVDFLAVGSSALAAGLVVSTLPPAAADAVAARDWRADQAVLDVVYDPWPTALTAAAGAAGATVVSGALMLLHQAAEQVRLMTGRPAPVEAMRAALASARPGCGV